MNCREFQEVLPDIVEGVRNPEQEAHLRSCPECSALTADLDLISQQAYLLRECEEPSPRVWNSIEIALRQEGLIRGPHLQPALVPAVSRRWHPAWWLAAAAVFLIAFALSSYQRTYDHSQVAQQPVPVAVQTAGLQPVVNPAVPEEDQQLLEMVSSHAPGMRDSYETNLRDVNAYIRDAQESLRENPNDEEARECLMQAYEQKAMIYEMALNRLQ
jgi:hypothetical protein